MSVYHNWAVYDFDEERDLEPYYKVWALNGQFTIPAKRPFDQYYIIHLMAQNFLRAGEKLSAPFPFPRDLRLKDNFWYISLVDFTEEEVRKREPTFRERLAPWIENPDTIYRGEMIPELEGYHERWWPIDVEKISELELLDLFQDWQRVTIRIWDWHFVSMWAGYSIYGLFEDLCQERFGIVDTDPQFKALMGGFDNREFVIDRDAYHLADRARELGLASLIQATPDNEEVLSKLKESGAARDWLQEFHEVVSRHACRVNEYWFLSTPSWMTKPSLAISDVRRGTVAGGVFAIDRERERVVKEREEAEGDFLSRVPYEQKDWFGKLMRGAQWLGAYELDHAYYTECIAVSHAERITKEIGRRLARLGMIDEPEDIYYLIPDEIQLAILGMYNRRRQQKTVEIRKEEYQKFLPMTPPMFIGDPSVLPGMLVKNPFLRHIIAIPVPKPELKADLYGVGSAPGVAEGIARVVPTFAEADQVQHGEILVTISTLAYWTPILGIVKAVVTDVGGSLSHPVIVGREFGIPAVAGTLEGTKKIQTGDKIRVDGDNCCVYILGKAGS
jgi:pyruvate,water dikinase